MVNPWDDTGPREYKFHFGVVFAAWLLGLLLTGAVGLGTVFLLKANEGEVIGWAYLVFGLAYLAGGNVVGGLLESPGKKTFVLASLLVTGGILMPAVLFLGWFFGPYAFILAVPGLVLGVAGCWSGAAITRRARLLEG